MNIRTRTMSTLMVLTAALTSQGCSVMTHELSLKGHSASQAGLQRSRDRSVAVVFLNDRVKKKYETSTDGHSFVFNNTRQYYEQAFSSALRDSVGRIEFFGGKPPDAYDWYVYPELELDASGIISHSCTATYAVTIEDAAGRRLAREEKKSEQSFIAMDQGTAACTSAISQSFGATYAALRRVDGQ